MNPAADIAVHQRQRSLQTDGRILTDTLSDPDPLLEPNL